MVENCLVVLPQVPYPPDSGGKLRSFHLLKLMTQRYSNLYLLTFFLSRQDKDNLSSLESILQIRAEGLPQKKGMFKIILDAGWDKPWVLEKYFSDLMLSRITKMVKNDHWLIHFDHPHTGQYVLYLAGRVDRSKVRFRMDAHNLEWVIAKRTAERYPWFNLIFSWQAERMKVWETRISKVVDSLWVVSQEDKMGFVKLGAEPEKVVVVPNGVDLERIRFREYTGKEKDIVFVGSMDWLPNEDGVLFFLREIWPIIQKARPDVRFIIVGKNPSERIKKFVSNKVIVTGLVQDVLPYIYDSALEVVPLRIGGGSRLKILEAMSAGRAVVSTSIGCEGIACEDGRDILIADQPEKFAEKVLLLLDDLALRKEIARQGRRLVEEKYGWQIPED